MDTPTTDIIAAEINVVFLHFLCEFHLSTCKRQDSYAIITSSLLNKAKKQVGA